MSSQDDAEALQERVDELEATVQKMLPGRRAFLAGAAGAAVGAVGMREASNVGEASDGTAVGQIGTSSEKVNVVAHDVTSDTVDTDSLQGVAYASKYSGASLADRVSAAFSDGVSIVRVAAQDTAYSWLTNVDMPEETELVFDNPFQAVTFEGSAAGGDADVALQPANRCRVVGGYWDTSRSDWNTSDPWEWSNPNGDAKGCRLYPGSLNNFEYGARWQADGSALTDNWLATPFTRNVWRAATYEAATGFSNRSKVHIGRSVTPTFTGTPIDLLVDGGNEIAVYNSDLGGSGTAVDTNGGVQLFATSIENASTAIKTRPGMGNSKVRWHTSNKNYITESGKFDLNSHDDLVLKGGPVYEHLHDRKELTPTITGGGIEQRHEETTGVGTSATTIVSDPGATDSVVWVYGQDASNDGLRFLDRVGTAGGSMGNVQEIFAQNAVGRTYSVSSLNLELAMASGTYDVVARVWQFRRDVTIGS